jgi:hypothetical protein
MQATRAGWARALTPRRGADQVGPAARELAAYGRTQRQGGLEVWRRGRQSRKV